MQLDDKMSTTQLHSLLAQKGVYYLDINGIQLHFSKVTNQVQHIARVIANTGACM